MEEYLEMVEIQKQLYHKDMELFRTHNQLKPFLRKEHS